MSEANNIINSPFQPSYEYYEDEIGNLGSNRVVFNTRLRTIRAGCILIADFGNGTKYLLGRYVQSNVRDDKNNKMKTAGGYLKLSARHAFPDQDAVSGLLREMIEEGFENQYAVKIDTIMPSTVLMTPEIGVLQFYKADLVSYPEKGQGRRCVLSSDSEGKSVVKWYDFDNVISKKITFPETVCAIADSMLYGLSGRIDFSDLSAKNKVLRNGMLSIGDDISDFVRDTTNISWLKPKGCSVYLSVPNDPDQNPAVKVCYLMNQFLHETKVGFNELGVGVNNPVKLEDALKEYVLSTYESFIKQDFEDKYVVK